MIVSAEAARATLHTKIFAHAPGVLIPYWGVAGPPELVRFGLPTNHPMHVSGGKRLLLNPSQSPATT